MYLEGEDQSSLSKYVRSGAIPEKNFLRKYFLRRQKRPQINGIEATYLACDTIVLPLGTQFVIHRGSKAISLTGFEFSLQIICKHVLIVLLGRQTLLRDCTL